MRNFLLSGLCALALTACGTEGLLGESEFLVKAAETAGKVEEHTVGNVAKAIDAYCKNVPKTARSLLVKRINSYTVKYEAIDLCGPAKAPAS